MLMINSSISGYQSPRLHPCVGRILTTKLETQRLQNTSTRKVRVRISINAACSLASITQLIVKASSSDRVGIQRKSPKKLMKDDIWVGSVCLPDAWTRSRDDSERRRSRGVLRRSGHRIWVRAAVMQLTRGILQPQLRRKYADSCCENFQPTYDHRASVRTDMATQATLPA